MRERIRIRSIPPRTALNILRKQGGKEEWTRRNGFSDSSVSIGRLPAKKIEQKSLEQDFGEFKIEDHVFRKPAKEKSNKSLIIPEAERINWQVEVHDNYDAQGNLGVILQFSGIEFINGSVFEKSRANYGQNSRVFFSQIGYKNKSAFLILATYRDIFESQVTAVKINVEPFFKEEIYLPQLITTYDPASMTVYKKNQLIVVGYNRL